ncbi:MAG: hypothetical protein U5L96_12265 [Owenweeksia sp.]|nr:hypothetical protein [Owenweeksia sp.]
MKKPTEVKTDEADPQSADAGATEVVTEVKEDQSPKQSRRPGRI